KKKNRSKWWDHFKRISETIAACKYYKTKIGCDTKNGTSPLSNKIKRCKKFSPNLDMKQKLIDLETKTLVNADGTTQTYMVPKLWEFDHDLCRKELDKMIIMDELLFAFVECEGFLAFCKVLNPQFVPPLRTTATRDCYALFIQKQNDMCSRN
ncbi:Zinc finger BED domain-containing protein DAYSLEEPER, partial [Bienertia sinuspersici]